MNEEQLQELLLQSLEHEKGGVLVYETAVKCAVNEDLKAEWEEYLEQTRTHVATLEDVCSALVEAMEKALATGDTDAAQLVACECVVLAETKDHLNWELLGQCAKKLTGDEAQALKDAYEEVEEEEDEHLYHTKGWCRELWLESLGLKAVLPPPEERKHVTTAIGAARAEQASVKSRRGGGSRAKQREKA